MNGNSGMDRKEEMIEESPTGVDPEYKCPDCGTLMEYRQGLFWDSTVTKCYFKYDCPNCGSTFDHRLSEDEEAEMRRYAKERRIVEESMKQKEKKRRAYHWLANTISRWMRK